MDSFIYSLNATVPIFLLMILGNVLYRRGMLDRHFSDAADRLVFKVCLPCMLFMNLSGTDIRRNFDGTYLGFCFGVTLASILGIWALARLFLEDRSMVGAFVQGSYRSSAAILGIAFIENIYGSSEMAPLMMLGSVPLYNIFAVVVLTMENDLIRGQAVGEKIRRACIGVLENPIIIGILLGLAASYARVELPVMLGRAAQNLGGTHLASGAGVHWRVFSGTACLGKTAADWHCSFSETGGTCGSISASGGVAGISRSKTRCHYHYAGISLHSHRLYYGEKYGGGLVSGFQHRGGHHPAFFHHADGVDFLGQML